eukprot:5284550-Pyramimonas_sp.AAC.1
MQYGAIRCNSMPCYAMLCCKTPHVVSTPCVAPQSYAFKVPYYDAGPRAQIVLSKKIFDRRPNPQAENRVDDAGHRLAEHGGVATAINALPPRCERTHRLFLI